MAGRHAGWGRDPDARQALDLDDHYGLTEVLDNRESTAMFQPARSSPVGRRGRYVRHSVMTLSARADTASSSHPGAGEPCERKRNQPNADLDGRFGPSYPMFFM